MSERGGEDPFVVEFVFLYFPGAIRSKAPGVWAWSVSSSPTDVSRAYG